MKKRYTTSTASRRQHSRIYYVSNGGVSTRVCKPAFLRIHGISNGRLSRAISASLKEGGTPHRDERGHHEPKNKTDESALNIVEQHIMSFPRYTSHYSRRGNPNRRYLSPELSISKMYELYREFCTDNGHSEVSEWVYRKRFNENHNLSFGRSVVHNIIIPVTFSRTLLLWFIFLLLFTYTSHTLPHHPSRTHALTHTHSILYIALNQTHAASVTP